MTLDRTALVLGINGSIGHATARALLNDGWKVRALARDPRRLKPDWPDAVEWIIGDAMDPAVVTAAAKGVAALMHAVSPPQYLNWREWGLPMLANAIEAAIQSGARLILPGNVYNYGVDAGSVVNEASPQHPATRKGAVRVEMEDLLRKAVEHRELRALVVRAGDFFGGSAAKSIFAQIILPEKPGKPVRYLGKFDVGHSWAYLPDLAETITRLLARDSELDAWDRFHFSGHWFPRGVAIAEAVRGVTGNSAPVRPFAWLPVKLLGPVYAPARELLEMRYLWDTPLQLDNSKLVAFLGSEPHTPLDDAVRAAVTGLQKSQV